MSPVLVHKLGDESYGVWVLVVSVTGYFSLLDLGMNRSIVRFVSMYEATSRRNDLNKFYNTSLLIYIGLGLLIVVLVVTISYFLDNIVDLDRNKDLARLVILVVGIDFAFSFPFGVMYAVIIANQKHTLANRINITNSVLRNVCLYLLLIFFPNLVCVTVVHVIFNTIKNYRIYRQVSSLCPYLVYGLSYIDRRIVSDIVNYSFHSFIVSVSSRVINFTDEIVVAIFMTVSDVTYYSIATNLIIYFEKIILSGTSVFVPYISELDAIGDQKKVNESFIHGSKYIFLLSLYVFTCILALGSKFVCVWMGDKYGLAIEDILLVLAVAKVVSLSQSMAVARFFGTSKHSELSKINMIEAGCNLICSLILVRQYGMIGIAFGTLIPSVICNGVVLPLIIFRKFEISCRDYLYKCAMRPLAVFLLVMILVLNVEVQVHSYLYIVGYGLFLTLLFSLLSFAIVLSSDERNYLYKYVLQKN